MTTTMTTVGYGDERAKQYGDGSNEDKSGRNMELVMYVQFGAMAVFAMIK